MPYAILSNRAVLAVSGEDALPFLQGLISNDIRKLTEQNLLYAALLSPQGKFLHDFFLAKRADAILIDCEKARKDDLLARLKLYKLRSKIQIDALETMRVAAWWNAPPTGYADPRLPQLGYRILSDALADEPDVGLDAYDAMRLSLAVPDGSRDMVVDKSLLLEWGFDDLHGVDFAKGCYIGQEVTARSKYRGQVKKFIHQIRAKTGILPETGTPITAQDTMVGELRTHTENQAIALLRLAELEQARLQSIPLRCGDAIVEASVPQWVMQAPPPLTSHE